MTDKKRRARGKIRTGRAPESGTDPSFHAHWQEIQPKAGGAMATPVHDTGSYPERIRFRHDRFGDLLILSAIPRTWDFGHPMAIPVILVIPVD